MKNTKKMLSLLLAMLILCQGAVLVFAEGTAKADEWTYDNSMLVRINTEESKIFTPEDFPNMNCIEVLTTEKLRTETGYSYELMLIFDTTDGFDWQSTADAILENGTLDARILRNYYAYDYEIKGSSIELNIEQQDIYLAIGESVNLNVTNVEIAARDFDLYGVVFEVDPIIVDSSMLETDGLQNYGVEEVCRFNDEDYYKNPVYEENRENLFFAYCYNPNECVELAAILNTISGIVSYYPFSTDPLPGGAPEKEFWENTDGAVLDMNLFGGEPKWDSNFLVNQTATITGKSVGEASITVTRIDTGSVYAQLKVTVYDPKDVNFDGVADSLDAAQVLKYDADLVEESDLHNYYGKTAGDVNFDGEINSLDAAFILKYDAGVL